MRAQTVLISSFVAIAGFAGVLAGWSGGVAAPNATALNAGAPSLLFKIDMGAGHGGPSGRYDALHETAFDYTWILTQVGRAK